MGGHFGYQAAELAIQNLLPDAVGALEILFTTKGGKRARLFFANEIAATATLCHVPGDTIAAKSRSLYRHALFAYRLAGGAVDCITSTYLWEKFGRE